MTACVFATVFPALAQAQAPAELEAARLGLRLAQQTPAVLSAAGPAGNRTQEEVLDSIDALDAGAAEGCRIMTSEAPQTYADPTEHQLDVLMEMLEDLEATWEVQPADADAFSLRQRVVGPEQVRRALFFNMLRSLPANTQFERNVVKGYFVLATSCGKILFKLTIPYCNGIEYGLQHLRVHYSDVDKKTYAAPFTDWWTGLRRESILGMVRGPSIRKRDTTTFVLVPVKAYPETYTNRLIAKDLISKRQEARAWSIYRVAQVAEFTVQLLPTGAVWRTILAKGVYQYEPWHWGEDATQITTDLALDVAPIIGQIKKARVASKFLWAVATTGAAARAGWNTYQNGNPTPVDALRLITLGMLGVHLRGLSKTELAADLARGRDEVQAAMNANPGLVSYEIARTSRAAWRRDYVKQFLSPPPYVRAGSYGKVLEHMHGASTAVLGQRIGFLDDLAHRLKQTIIPQSGDLAFDANRYLDGLSGELAQHGKSLSANVEDLGLATMDRLQDEYRALRAANPNANADDVWRFLIQDELYLQGAGKTNYYEAGTVHVTLMRFSGDPAQYSFSQTQKVILAEELHRWNSRILQEEITHAMGDVAPKVGFHTVSSIFGTAGNQRYVPLTVEAFNFHAWLSRTSLQRIKALLPPASLAAAQSGASARGVSLRIYLLSQIHEADALFRLKAAGVPVNSVYIAGNDELVNYPARALADIWLTSIYPNLF